MDFGVKYFIVLIYFIIMNLVSFYVMGKDKNKAISGQWRTSENSIFTLALLGGGLGVFLGMKTFYHKVKKEKFIIFVPIILVINIVSMIILIMI